MKEIMMELPKDINPCPIMEALFEVRFDSGLPGDAIFGIVYNSFKEEYPNLIKLPILQLPEQIRNSDPALVYNPHYQLRNDEFVVQIGPKVISIAKQKPYETWKPFHSKIVSTFKDVAGLNIITNISRIALKYINFFQDCNIVDNSNLTIALDGESLDSKAISLETKITMNNSVSILKVLTNATIAQNNTKMTGSIVDIDTVLAKIPENINLNDLGDYAATLHQDEKQLFYKILSEDYMKTLEVTY
ncbi:MAG: TIGR04255 family protein [Thermodesulfobacteriota bacterium]